MQPTKGKLEFTWRPLDVDLGGQPGTDMGSHFNMSKCMFIAVSISILKLKIISGHLEAAGGQPSIDMEVKC